MPIGSATPYDIEAGILAAVKGGKTHVEPTPNAHRRRIVISSGDLSIVGRWSARAIIASPPGDPVTDRFPAALTVTGTARVRLERITISGARVASAGTGRGVVCSGSGARLELYDVVITGNDTGLVAEGCGEPVLGNVWIRKKGRGAVISGRRVLMANTAIHHNDDRIGTGGPAGLEIARVASLDILNVAIASNRLPTPPIPPAPTFRLQPGALRPCAYAGGARRGEGGARRGGVSRGV